MLWREIAHKRIKDNCCPYCQVNLSEYQRDEIYSAYNEDEWDGTDNEFRVEVDCECPKCKGVWEFVVSFTVEELIEKAHKLWIHSEDYPRKNESSTGQQKICL